jgi:hypothetical protein
MQQQVTRGASSGNQGCGGAGGGAGYLPVAGGQDSEDAAHTLAAESAQADFACLLRRIHSLCKPTARSHSARPLPRPLYAGYFEASFWTVVMLRLVDGTLPIAFAICGPVTSDSLSFLRASQ